MIQYSVGSLHAPSLALMSALTHAAIALCLAILGGCALIPCPPLRAAWYLDDTPAALVAAPTASLTTAASATSVRRPTIFLALLNEGQRSAFERVVVNPAVSGGGVVFHNLPELMPGELRLLKVNGQLGPCALPVAVQLHCGNGRSRTLAVSGSLPNYLHATWIESCQANQAGSE